MSFKRNPQGGARLEAGDYIVETGGYMQPYKRIDQMVRAGKALKQFPMFVDTDEPARRAGVDMVFTQKELKARAEARDAKLKQEAESAARLAEQAIIDRYLQNLQTNQRAADLPPPASPTPVGTTGGAGGATPA